MISYVSVLRCALLALLVAAAGCRALPAGARPSPPEPSLAEPSLPEPSLGELSVEEAPEVCGFPAGTALEHAGRSTTAELGVQEVVGDPMSDDPADIYVTRDKFDQGELQGRLVCAIFVDDPGFVEITVHPDDVAPPSPTPAAPEPSKGVGEAAAIEIALGAADADVAWEVSVADRGPIFRVMPHWEDQEWGAAVGPETWVWRIHLVSGDRGLDVIVDYLDGSVHGTAAYIVN